MLRAEVAVRIAEQCPKRVQIDQDAGNPHHGQCREVRVQPATGGLHLRAAVPDGLERLAPRAQLPDEIRPMEIAARLPHGKEDRHFALRGHPLVPSRQVVGLPA